MTPKRKKSLAQLARLMNKQNRIPVPVIKPLLDCFDLVITPEECDFLLRMGTKPCTFRQAARIADLPQEVFVDFFDTLLKKGLVWTHPGDDGEELFILASIMVGWFELQLSGGQETIEKKEFARRLDRLFNCWKKLNFFPLRNWQNYKFLKVTEPYQTIAPIIPVNGSKKTFKIKINRKIPLPESKVYPLKNIYELIENHGNKDTIALMHCFCRQWRKMVGEPCRFDFPAESCIIMGHIAEYIVRFEFGRRISINEALKVIDDTQKAGGVHIVFHERDDIELPEIGICNCCWDCCGILGSYNRGIVPIQFKSYYIANIQDNASCLGCRKCEAYCPVNSISIKNKKPATDSDRCIGCGQCAYRCPEEKITLVFHERHIKLPLLKKSKARLGRSR